MLLADSSGSNDQWSVTDQFVNIERRFIGLDFSSPINQISQEEFRGLIENGELTISVDNSIITNSNIDFVTIPDPELVSEDDDAFSTIQDIDYGYDDSEKFILFGHYF